ncbi:MAG: hypothetical protein Q9191_003950 [Dirinaria sp. TL-2023a]
MFLIDTPGFDDPVRSDTDILQAIASCLADLYEGLSFEGLQVTLSGIIYIQSIDEARMTGSMKKNLKMFQLLIGEHNMAHCVLVTSKWRSVDLAIAQSRESELVQTPDYWGSLLASGASIGRYEDTRLSALELINLSKSAGVFVPQLAQEYAVEGKELHQTAAGRAIDEDITRARERHEQDLERLRAEHRQTLEFDKVQDAVELKPLLASVEARLQNLADEMQRLRADRNLAQIRMDEFDAMSAATSSNEDMLAPDAADDKPRARKKRALRWFGRFLAMGAAVTMSVLTHGAMIPVGMSLYGAVESLCQRDKDREAGKRIGKWE